MWPKVYTHHFYNHLLSIEVTADVSLYDAIAMINVLYSEENNWFNRLLQYVHAELQFKEIK